MHDRVAGFGRWSGQLRERLALKVAMGVSLTKKNNGRDPSGEFTLPFSASLQWLCPSTKEEEEVIDSHNPNSLMVAELPANISNSSLIWNIPSQNSKQSVRREAVNFLFQNPFSWRFELEMRRGKRRGLCPTERAQP